MNKKPRKRNLLQRIFGIPSTKLPADPSCFSYSDGRITIDLNRAPELGEPGGSIRLEGGALPVRVLVIHGDDGTYHAFRNKCQHAGRRLDPLASTGSVECCSVSKTTYRYDGRILSGPAKGPLETYPVQCESGKLIIAIEAP